MHSIILFIIFVELFKYYKLKGIHILPMEILIHCILNYLQTPMNYNINLNVFDYVLKTDSMKLEQLSRYILILILI